MWPCRYGDRIPGKKKPSSALRDKTITVRASEAEKKRWEASASALNLNVSNWIRYRANSQNLTVARLTYRPRPRKAPIRESSPVDPQLLRAISAIGNNVNQIARWLNQGGQLNLELTHTLIRIERLLERIAEAAEPESVPEVDSDAD